MESILLYVDESGSMEARFQAALDLAAAFGSHITCLQATRATSFMVADPFTGMRVSNELFEYWQNREAAQRARLEERLKVEGARWSWIHGGGDPAQSIVEASCLADLVIGGLADETAPEQSRDRALVSGLVIDARAPVLVVPQGWPRFDCQGGALVAWNGSLECAHALRFAVPLLRKAARVTLITVSDDPVAMPATEGAEYLSRQGVGCELRQWPRNGRDVGAALLDAVRTLGGSYLVAGAYGHTRFREAIVGGVTRELIEAARVPLVLAH